MEISPNAQKDELLTVRELAREWRQHPATIYKKIAAGAIPAVRLGDGLSALRVPRAELERRMQTSTAGPSSAVAEYRARNRDLPTTEAVEPDAARGSEGAR